MGADKYRERVKRLFLAELEENGGYVERAIRSIKTSRKLINEERDSDPNFAAAWERIIDLTVERLETEAARRASGYTEELVYRGLKTGETVMRYSDNLLMFLLKAHRPEKYRDMAQGKRDGVNLSDKELDDALTRMMTKRGQSKPDARDTEEELVM